MNAREKYIAGINTPGSVRSEQNRWEEAGGRGVFPVMNDETYSSIMNYDPTNPHSSKAPLRQDQNPSFYSLGDFRYRGKNPALNSGEPWEVYNRDIDTRFSPGWMDAGITNRNLGGYKVMNASDPTADGGWIDRLSKQFPDNYESSLAGSWMDPTADGGWIDRLSRWWYGDNDPENDYLGPPPDDTIDEGDYYDPNNPKHFMVPEENPPYDPDNPYHFKIPEGMDLDDIDIEELINMERYNI